MNQTLYVCLILHQRRRQLGRNGNGVVLVTTLIAWSGFNTQLGHVVACLDTTLYNVGIEQAPNSVEKNNSKKFTEMLDH